MLSKEQIANILSDLDNSGYDGYYGDILMDAHSYSNDANYQTGNPISRRLIVRHLTPEQSNIERNSQVMLQNIYTKYPAMKNMGEVIIKADPEFTREKTGAGDIEFMDTKKLENNTVHYNNGYTVENPNPNGLGLVYNPNTNTEQDIFLDMLHGMTNDPTYAKHRSEFKKAFLDSKYSQDFEREWDWYNKETNGDNDGKQQYKENWIDGQVRGLLFEGTPEDFNKKNYWQGARNEYLRNPEIAKSISKLYAYLQSNLRNLEYNKPKDYYNLNLL